MKRIGHILLALTLALSWCLSAWAQTQAKQLPDVTSTEGREFFVAWLPNGGSKPIDPDLKLLLIASSRKANTIVVEYPDGSTQPYTIAAGRSTEITITAQSVYWDMAASEEEIVLSKGIRVYSQNDERFTLYSINQNGVSGTYSFDGAHIIPVEALGTEYIVQTGDADETATEFVVMSTKPGETNVSIDLTVSSRSGNVQHLDVTLNGSKQIYIVRSKAPNPEDLNDFIDLSGSTICADQRIAVWSGNQAASIPNQDAMSKDHAYDQLLPVTKWGKTFLIPLTGLHTQYNEVHVNGLLDNTTLTVTNRKGSTNYTLSAANDDSVFVVKAPLGGNMDNNTLYLQSDKPVQVYLYSSSGAANPYDDDDENRHLQGDPSMTIIPPLEYLTDTTIFQTYNGGDGGLVHEMRLWARTSDVSGIRLDGVSIASSFSAVAFASGYSQAKISLTHGIHTITAPKKCFSGYVYGMNDGQTYMYPVGYDFTPQPDSLFLLDNDSAYAVRPSEWKEDYVSSTEGGWYLDKILQDDKTYLLDSIFVCDSTTLKFPINTHSSWYEVIWEIEGSIQDNYFTPLEQLCSNVSRPELEHQFTLLPIDQNQEPFEDFEVRGIVIRKPIFCDLPEDKWERDTFNTVVRVMRQYNDTTWRVICDGDTVHFFKDTVWTGSEFKLQETIFNNSKNDLTNGYYKYPLGETTITRSYISSGGCDSLSTLKLFVCSPHYKKVDTVVCEDGLRYLDFGKFFQKYKSNNSWPKADTTLYDTLRATECMGTPEYEPFLEHCPEFNGCDSVLELHLKVMTVKRNTKRVNQCMSQGSVFEWREEGSNRLIHTFSADTMTRDSSYVFRDYVQYVNCDDCPDGGCDSVRNTLYLMFVSDDGQQHTQHVCQGDKYTYSNMNFVYTFDSNGKLCNKPYVVTGTVEIRGVVDGKSVVMCSFEDEVTFIVDTVYKDQMTYDTICWDPQATDQTYEWFKHPNFSAIPITKDGQFRYVDTLKRYDCDCDSICVLELTVGRPYENDITEAICDNGSFMWQDTLFYGVNFKGDIPAKSRRIESAIDTRRDLLSRFGCDSIFTLHLDVHPTYIAEQKDTMICANEEYDFYGTKYNTSSNPWIAGETYQLKITDFSTHGCDSLVLHNITVNPVYLDLREENDTVCQSPGAIYTWDNHPLWTDQQSLSKVGSYELVDYLETTTGCDSIWHRTLVVIPSYDLKYERTMSSEDTIHWEGTIYAGRNAVFDNPDGLPIVECSGKMEIVDSMTTRPIGTHSCDSIRTLTLKVGQTFHDTVYDATCANCGTYQWVITSPITGKDTTIYITDLPTAYDEKIYYDSLETAMGYDSIYVLRLTAYPSYSYTDAGRICQGETYIWNDHMPESSSSVVHKLYVKGKEVTKIPTDVYGIIEVVDSMKTDTIYTNPETGVVKPMHCDSVWTLTLTIDPTYNDRYVELTDYVSMASNDTVSHFTQPKTLFVGYDFDYNAAGTSTGELEQLYNNHVVYIDRSEGTRHRDSVGNTSQYGCDSVHYVQISICEMKFTQLYDSIGDNDTIWHFGGEVGTINRGAHTQPYITGYEFHKYDDGTPVDYSVADGRTMREYLFIDTLFTANGCDSIVHDLVRVFPTYRFDFDTAVCSNKRYDWRVLTKLNERRTGTYYDSVNYVIGTHIFDSVYVLNLDVMPSGYWQYDTMLCKNDTIWWHYKQIYYRPGGLTYVEAEYKDETSPCGEVHHLDLTFMPYYGSTLIEYDTVCQDISPYTWISPGEINAHTRALYDAEGNAITTIPADEPGEFTYYDSLKTVSCGCDSVYTLHLVVQPAYRFYTDTAICVGDTMKWVVKDKDGLEVTKDIYTSDVTTHLYDTIHGTTTAYCDSSYYLHVFVDQPYEIYVDTTLCASDGQFKWTGDHGERVYDDLIAESRTWSKPREFYDTLTTETQRGKCDSIMYLHLTIAPSADSIWTDTICTGETYRIFEYEYTTAGKYEFDHTNYWGCDVHYALTLVTIDPTVVTILPEPVCINEAGQDFTYTVRYTYQGQFQPISYTVHYDSVAQEVGFEDQDSKKIPGGLMAGQEYDLYIPTPRIDQKENYPRPDHYYATIAFENGVCLSDSLMTFPMKITMSYPNWLLEQRHGDVIALLNEKYNGGYTWTEYQWYENDSMLVGQTKPYLYIPTGLTVGAEYHVELVRTDETEAFPTCPIMVSTNINNDFAPTMGYLAVTPTCVVTGNPWINILSRKDGMYRISTINGHTVSEGVFYANVTKVGIPAVEGMYIVQLWSDDTPEEPYRAIKVIVREQCPNCDTPF